MLTPLKHPLNTFFPSYPASVKTSSALFGHDMMGFVKVGAYVLGLQGRVREAERLITMQRPGSQFVLGVPNVSCVETLTYGVRASLVPQTPYLV